MCEGRDVIDGDVAVAVVVRVGEFPVDFDIGIGVGGVLVEEFFGVFE